MKKTSILFALLSCASLFSQQAVWRVNTLAGVYPLGNDGPGADALLGRPRHLAYDTEGNLYIADTDNNQIRRLGRDGRIVAVAGRGWPGSAGDGGPAVQADLNRPRAVALDGNQLFIADSGNYRVRVMNLETGIIDAYAGQGVAGFGGDGGPALEAKLRSVACLAIDAQGNLLIADSEDHRVRRVNRHTRAITTFAGTGSPGRPFGSTATATPLYYPGALAVDPAKGSVYIANRLETIQSGTVVQVDASGNVWFFATASDPAAMSIDATRRTIYIADYRACALLLGNLDGVGIVSRFPLDCETSPGLAPFGVAFDPTGGIAISTIGANRILRQNLGSSDFQTIAGRRPFSGDGSPAPDATLFQPAMAISDGEGGYFVADTYNCAIRRISVNIRTTSTWAGRPGICSRNITSLNLPVALVRDRRGNLYVSVAAGVRRISAEDRSISTVEPLTNAAGLALDPSEENLFIVENTGHRITRINLASGLRTVLAGSANGTPGFAGDGGPASDARFRFPTDVAVDRAGNVYVADSGNHRIRRIDADTLRVSTVAGNGTLDAVAAGPALASGIPLPTSIALGADGVLYAISANRLLRIDPTGTLQVLAGSTQGGPAADGVPGPNARFNEPRSVRVDGSTVLVADTLNNRIRTVTPVSAAPGFALASGPTSGNNQSGPVNKLLASPLVVRVRLADGTPMFGIPVSFVASSGRLEPAGPVLTGSDGNASVRLTMPPIAGPVTVTASMDGLAPVTFTATALAQPTISSVITAGAFGAANRIAPGTWIELYGTDFTRETRQWSGGDFVSNSAPTTLGGVRVLINSQPAFVQRISPGQINAVVPDGIGAGRLPVQVINGDGASESFMVEAAARAPALLAPAAFAVADTQYVAAMLPDGTFAMPERPARAGDRLVMYGVGFGATVPAIPAGQIASQATALPNLRVTIGGADARVEYGGLAAGFVGLYQINVVVPEVAATGPAWLGVSVDGVAVAQTLAVAVAR